MPNNNAHSRRLTSRKKGELALFRREAIEYQQSQWLGRVLLAPSIPHTLFVIFAILSTTAVLSILVLGEYTRKEKVQGWLVPEKGLIQVFTSQQSVVSSIHVTDGDLVARGAALATLSSETESEAYGATLQEVVRNLTAKQVSLRAERLTMEAVHRKEFEELEHHIAALKKDISLRDRELEALRERVTLTSQDLNRLQRLQRVGAITDRRFSQVQDQRLDLIATVNSLERSRANVVHEIEELSSALDLTPLRNQIKISEIDREIAQIEQELAEAESRRKRIITAPQSGTITAMQLSVGGTVTPDNPIFSIVPSGSILQAQLFVPGQARGFLKPNQKVKIRYQSFPYQRFGYYEGEIKEISQSAIAASDLNPNPFAMNASERSGSLIYLVTVLLEQQNATAYGDEIPLQPGMQLEAHIEIEKRRLIEWVFAPLFTMRGQNT